ncbi:sugar ABC transporter permease [Paenibacillus baekrokdamisoli]|uniref:Sugar ABC transporter permease n=1 Tax=Paenibacillus baekrokdamisoli TaxID=1712516 RepID=A0A3G9JJ55_9BACL|nr:ABC transporter permease subunit [Paenibacillus baekrokdamisoli]MBB3069402.1 putative aldouronate transport system permease protein [Paenibacillus baekrokdamisoli]BBH25023.1 sugar ABC transporter permease [Paenibacillus baekrokdamisoli]BBH25041.1 sugar ABC transporter permease [Paenibacillus baekrokdamisoli]
MEQAYRLRRKSGIRKYGVLLLMMVPGLAYLLINNYLPMFGLLIAFKDFNSVKGIFGSDWIGFRNFEYLFKTQDAYIITRNAILYNFVFVVLNTVAAVAIAIGLNEIRSRFMSRVYQSVMLLPHLISMVIVSYLAYSLLSVDTGFMNKTVLPWLGLNEISWYTEAAYWPFILTIISLWKGAGFLCVIYLAAIIGIDPEYYEAAKLDGATKWQQIRTITLPLLSPIIIMMTLLAIGKIFYSDFGLFYQVPLGSGALNDTTQVIDTYVYRALMNLGDIGMSSAAGLYQSVVGFVLVLLSNYAVRKFSKDNALF